MNARTKTIDNQITIAHVRSTKPGPNGPIVTVTSYPVRWTFHNRAYAPLAKPKRRRRAA